MFEFAATLPTTQTFRAGARKLIMRNAMQGLLPEEILSMWDKVYASAIFDRGLQEREQSKVWRLLTDMRAAELGYVDEKRVRDAYRNYLRREGSVRFCFTITLEDWLRRYF